MRSYGNKSTTSKVSRRFVKRTARRIARPIGFTGVNMRVEMDELIYMTTDSVQPLFGTSNSYIDFSAILLANPAFVSQATNFMRYKITGCSFTATPVFSETSLQNAFLNNGCPPVFVQQYPILTTQSVGNEVLFSDNNLQVKPLSLTQSKYWTYKQNFMIGSGQGAGTWNQTNAVASQQGQFSIRAPGSTFSTNPAAYITLYAIRVCLYTTLDGKSR